MSKGPGLFSDIGKRAREILYKDYSYDRKFSISTQTNGLAITSTTLQKGGLSVGDVTAQYKYNNAVIDIKVDTQSNIATTLTLNDVLPSTKSIASMKVPDYNSGKLELQYSHEHAGIGTSVSLNKHPILDVSATFGTLNTVLGVEGGYDTFTGEVTKYNVGVSMTKPDFRTSVILTEKGDLIKASYVHYVEQVRTTTVVEFTNRFSEEGSTLTVGGSCQVDDLTLIKLKLNNQGNFGAVLQHEFKPKSMLTMAADFDYNSLDTNPKFGLSLALKP